MAWVATYGFQFFVALYFLPYGDGAACLPGADAYYFWSDKYILVGELTDPVGRLYCAWMWQLNAATVCPYYDRTDNLGAGVPESSMIFGTVPTGQWPCSGSGNNFCWYSARIVSGPDANTGKYNTSDGQSIDHNMIFSGVKGENGRCNAVASDCSDTQSAWSCQPGYLSKDSIAPYNSLQTCRETFCEEEAYRYSCCAKECTTGYFPQVGNACPIGKYGGAYSKACQDHTCVATDEDRCCVDTTECLPGDYVELFGDPPNANFMNVHVGNVLQGRVHCDWTNPNTPPMTCPYYTWSNGAFASTSQSSENCAREGGLGPRYCWRTTQIIDGPHTSLTYDTVDFTEVPWYKLFKQTLGGGYTACRRPDVDCVWKEYECSTALSRNAWLKPLAQVGPGPSSCQTRHCNQNSFAMGCCQTTTNTSTTSNMTTVSATKEFKTNTTSSSNTTSLTTATARSTNTSSTTSSNSTLTTNTTAGFIEEKHSGVTNITTSNITATTMTDVMTDVTSSNASTTSNTSTKQVLTTSTTNTTVTKTSTSTIANTTKSTNTTIKAPPAATFVLNTNTSSNTTTTSTHTSTSTSTTSTSNTSNTTGTAIKFSTSIATNTTTSSNETGTITIFSRSTNTTVVSSNESTTIIVSSLTTNTTAIAGSNESQPIVSTLTTNTTAIVSTNETSTAATTSLITNTTSIANETSPIITTVVIKNATTSINSTSMIVTTTTSSTTNTTTTTSTTNTTTTITTTTTNTTTTTTATTTNTSTSTEDGSSFYWSVNFTLGNETNETIVTDTLRPVQPVQVSVQVVIVSGRLTLHVDLDGPDAVAFAASEKVWTGLKKAIAAMAGVSTEQIDIVNVQVDR